MHQSVVDIPVDAPSYCLLLIWFLRPTISLNENGENYKNLSAKEKRAKEDMQIKNARNEDSLASFFKH